MARVLVLMLLPAMALAEESSRTELELGGGYEQLDNSFHNWSEQYLSVQHQQEDRQRADLMLRQTTRYTLTDVELQAAFAHPLNTATLVVLEGSVSDSHRVLSKWTSGITLSQTLGSGWGTSLGAKRREYDSGTVDSVSLTAERYWSRWRAAYVFTNSHLTIGGSANTQRLQLDNYYGESDRLGVSYAAGEELEPFGSTEILYSKIHAVVVVGQHWLSPDWGLSYSVGAQRQGELYTRKGVTLGLRHRF